MEEIIVDQEALGAMDMEHEPEAGALRVLTPAEVDDVSGGFACGGLCIAGAAFTAGAIAGAGGVTGYYAAKRS